LNCSCLSPVISSNNLLVVSFTLNSAGSIPFPLSRSGKYLSSIAGLSGELLEVDGSNLIEFSPGDVELEGRSINGSGSFLP
jgi:hypothetical protein